MSINPNAKRILCFGDSNTWGDPPDSEVRYPTSVRKKRSNLFLSNYKD